MKFRPVFLSASIAAALSTLSPAALTHPQPSANALLGVDTREAPRVIQTVDVNQLATIAKSHFGFLAKASASVKVPDDMQLNHLQLVLKPSALRQAAMEDFIASQHDPKSPHFHQWLSPAQFGQAFGVEDSDIAAATAWLVSQGFTVNAVYPNKTQIDFTGTVGQVETAFHTQEAVYTLGTQKHLANESDIRVPAALSPILAGVMGLNDFRPQRTTSKPLVGNRDSSQKGFVLKNPGKKSGGTSQAIPQIYNTARGLVPNDLMTMYGIREIRANGVVGKGITIAVLEDGDMVPSDWTNFTSTFNLQKYGGTWSSINPAPPTGATNCIDHNAIFGFDPENGEDDDSAIFDSEWTTAIAPGANVVVASCADSAPDSNGNFQPTTSNYFGGVFIAGENLVNASSNRPDIISSDYGYGEFFTDAASKTAIDQMWAQADAEGISVFIGSGAGGSNLSFAGTVIGGSRGNTAIDANSFGTSAHDTVVGVTDIADVLDGTTSQYFASTPSVVGGSALSYVPEIPWNESCGNGVAAKAKGFKDAISYCKYRLSLDPSGNYVVSTASSGAPSSVDAKPAWQRLVYNAANDQSRDLPDVSIFGGSFGGEASNGSTATYLVVCSVYPACSPDFSQVGLTAGSTAPLFAGIQALIDQGVADRGLPPDQGNAAPTLYALAAKQYGAPGSPASDIATCSADNGGTGTANCVFHNVTRGSISSSCYKQVTGVIFDTPNCYYYGPAAHQIVLGLTSTDTSPTSYGVGNKAYGAQPGWSFASGLGSVNTRNLLIAWRQYLNAPAASVVPNAK